VVLDVDGHALIGHVIARALRHGLAEHDASLLQAEVVVQPAHPVLLDEAQFLADFSTLSRPARDPEITLGEGKLVGHDTSLGAS
jgi:hypothetical protein